MILPDHAVSDRAATAAHCASLRTMWSAAGSAAPARAMPWRISNLRMADRDAGRPVAPALQMGHPRRHIGPKTAGQRDIAHQHLMWGEQQGSGGAGRRNLGALAGGDMNVIRPLTLQTGRRGRAVARQQNPSASRDGKGREGKGRVFL